MNDIARNFEIVRLINNGQTMASVARQFCISASRIREIYLRDRIRYDQTWMFLPIRIIHVFSKFGYKNIQEVINEDYFKLLELKGIGIKTIKYLNRLK